MALCIAGDFDPDETIKLIDKKFSVLQHKDVLHFCLLPFSFCLSCNLLIKKPLNTFMSATEPIVIEMFYTLTCPNCRSLKRMLQEVLPEFGNKFKLENYFKSGSYL